MKLSNTTQYIEVTDLLTEIDCEHYRHVSLGYNIEHPDSLRLLGGLSHCSEITFDEANAKKMIAWLKHLLKIKG